MDAHSTIAHTVRRGAGFTMIEVLVALLITSVALLGLARLEVGSLHGTRDALTRSQAVALAYSLLDAMRSNRAFALAGDYDAGAVKPPAIVTDDLTFWRNQLAKVLPSPQGSVSVSGDTAKVTVRWQCSGAAATCAGRAALQAVL